MSNKKRFKPLKLAATDREITLLNMAAMIGFLTIDMAEAQKNYVTAHNDNLCSLRIPTAAARNDVAAALCRFEMLSRKRVALELALQKLVGVPALKKDPRRLWYSSLEDVCRSPVEQQAKRHDAGRGRDQTVSWSLLRGHSGR
jgi:hypothetical protein